MATQQRVKEAMDLWDARKTKETQNIKPHPVTGRLIDSHPGERNVPMRLLVLGMPRTGTLSIFTALEQLGYNPYHMVKAVAAPQSNLTIWREALLAKYHGKGEKWGRKEFDKILGDYDAVLDVPCATFAEELIEAYPEAKVLLNTRDVDKWLASMDASFATVLRWKGWELMAPWDPALAEPWWEFAKLVIPATFNTFSDFSSASPARQAFAEHYERVRRVCPPERLLEYEVKEGWGPLCEFVGKEVPERPYPRINDKMQFIVAHRLMWQLALGKMVGKVSLMMLPAVAVGAAVWMGRVPWLSWR